MIRVAQTDRGPRLAASLPALCDLCAALFDKASAGPPAAPASGAFLSGLRGAANAAAEPLRPCRQPSEVLDARRRPGKRVLLQGEVLFLEVALMERGDDLVLPSAPGYGPAVPRPAAFATCVMLAPPGCGRDRPAAEDEGRTDRLRDREPLTAARGVRVNALRGADRPPGRVSVG
jgi:hypothetical protein